MKAPSETLLQVATLENLAQAWKHVQRRNSAAGIDRVTCARYATQDLANLASLSDRLRDQSYRPLPARRTQLPGDAGRELAIPTVEDRIVQRSIATALNVRYERQFSDSAYAYRPGRSVEQALAAVERHLAAGRRWFVRVDIKKFFDRIDRERLLRAMAEDGLEGDVLRLVRRILSCGTLAGASVYDPAEGALQGSALSPLLSNVYLRPLDSAMDRAGQIYLRYADDMLLLAETAPASVDALALLAAEVEQLGLELNARKTRRGQVASGFDFLGAHFDSGGRRFSARALQTLNQRAEALPPTAQGLADLVQLWQRYYGSLQLHDITTLPVLVGRLAISSSRGQKDEVMALARRRLALPAEPVDSEVHILLTEVWASADQPQCARALALDARLALRSGPDAEARRRLCAALDFTDESWLDWLEGPPKRAAAELASRGLIALADGLRSNAKLGRRKTPSRVDVGVSDAALSELLDRLIGREGIHAAAIKDQRQHWRFVAVDEPLTATRLRAHLRGQSTYGVYQVRRDQTVRLAAFEVYVKRDTMLPPWSLAEAPAGVINRWNDLLALAHDHAASLIRAAARVGLPAHIEDTGRNGRRVWIFFDASLALRHARSLLVRLAREIGEPPKELGRRLMPAADRLQHPPGPWLPLPLAVDRRTGNRASWLDRSGRPITSQLEALCAASPASVSRVKALVTRGPLISAAKSSHSKLDLSAHPTARRIIAACAVIGALAEKAQRLGLLDGLERATLIESLGHLPKDEAPAVLLKILSPTGIDHFELRRRLKRLATHPISCGRIRQRHAAISSEQGCSCRFRGLFGGAYPTPILHGLKPDQLPAFAEAIKAKRAKRQAAGKNPESGAVKPPPARSDAEPPTVSALVAKLRALAEQQANVDRGRRRVEKELDQIFSAAGTDRLRYQSGWLVRVSGNPPKYVIEI